MQSTSPGKSKENKENKRGENETIGTYASIEEERKYAKIPEQLAVTMDKVVAQVEALT